MQSKQRKGPTNPIVASLTLKLKVAARENEASVWQSISKALEKPRRRRAEINLSKIARYTEKNETVVVAGKVLSAGELTDPVTVAALSFSARAKQKIEAAKGRAISIEELVAENPSGSGVRILK